jgi:hypothetical protein
MAQAAEKFLDHTWHYHLDGRGPAPTGGLVNEVAQFRGRAQARLAAAMALMRSISDECPPSTSTLPRAQSSGPRAASDPFEYRDQVLPLLHQRLRQR